MSDSEDSLYFLFARGYFSVLPGLEVILNTFSSYDNSDSLPILTHDLLSYRLRIFSLKSIVLDLNY